MFYWMERNSGGSETLDSLSNISKAEILRGIVTEKLTTAAQEILAVVERTVAGYEEEASGFRQEIHRQRRQLELLLQPRVKLERRALIPDLEGHEVVVVSEEEEEEEEEKEEQQHTQQSGVEDTGSLGLLWYDDDEEGDGGDEDQQLSAGPATSSRQRRDLKDPDYQIPSRLISPSGQSDRRRLGRPRISDTQRHLDLRIRILEDSRTDVLSKRVYKKYPLQELQCPRGLQEADFLDLLRSTFPQLAAEKPFDVFTSDRTRRLQPLKVKTLTAEEIYRSTGHSALYIRLKAQEEEDVQVSEEELHLLQRKVDAVKDSSFTSEETRLNTSSPVLSCSSTSQHEDMETAEADDGGISESAGLWSLLVLSESEGDGDEVSDGDNDWKPDKSEKHLRNSEPEKTTRKRRVKHSGFQMMQSPLKASTDNDDAPLSCKVCRTLRGSMNMLIKHAWSHVDEPERLCGVCGEHSESAEELRSHLQSHQKTHSCNICGKSFLSITGLNGHVARHKGKKPYECKICHKAFAQRSVLRNHKWVHEVDKPHKCDLCQKSCVSKFDLTRHRLTHTGEKLHRCNMCGKSLRSLETLSQHMLSHSGHTVREAALICEICSKTFHTKRKLEVHMRVHRGQRPHVCSKCNKGFLCNSNLVTHMRVHTGEKPYKCSVCDMAFSQSHCVKRHMKSHHIGSDCRKTEAQILSKRINGTKSVKRVR